MYIQYWTENKGTDNEIHHMQISGTGIIITGLKKQACFKFLKEKLDTFIKEFKMLKQVEIGNIQESSSPYQEKMEIIPEIIKRDREFEDYLAHKIRQEKRKGKFNK